MNFGLIQTVLIFKKKKGKIKILFYIVPGFRSALATKSLQEMGFTNVSNAAGGFDALKNIGLDIVSKISNLF